MCVIWLQSIHFSVFVSPLLWHCLLPIKLKIQSEFISLFLFVALFLRHSSLYSTSNCHRLYANDEQHTFQNNIICYFCLIRHSSHPMNRKRNFSHETAESERDQLVCTICVIFSFVFMCHRELTQNSNRSTCA